MTQTQVKTRFAPSPTGHLHPGNARTALFNFLLARHEGGIFLLRLEDTDAGRGNEASVDALQQDLNWLGIHWDEGGRECRQSRRGAVYAEQYRRLEERGQAYPCFCSTAELERVRRGQLARGEAPRYPGTCASLPAQESRRRLEAGEPATLRFRVGDRHEIRFHDLVRGEQRFRGADIGDFVVRRADGSPAFFFSNAVDDALMGVTHVLRGDDHLANTPRQLMLLQALGLPTPVYGHLGLVVDETGAPLSKRRGSTTLAQLRAQGYLPGALCNYLARLGHAVASAGCLDMGTLARGFAPGRLGRAPARFDLQQLRHWQKLAVAGLDPERMQEWLEPEIRDRVPAGALAAFVESVRPNVVFPEDAIFWARVLFGDQIRWDRPARELLRDAGGAFFARARRALEGGPDDASVERLKHATGRKGAALFRPLRVALTGVDHGPGIAALIALIPPPELARRLAAAEREARASD
ncbi:MAG TPA: glutamate--tRNA ligase [Gammaproteobacteria bacterium]|nr:glutamate--tRNA ligase [Gammaproteobacteria bacterium]